VTLGRGVGGYSDHQTVGAGSKHVVSQSRRSTLYNFQTVG